MKLYTLVENEKGVIETSCFNQYQIALKDYSYEEYLMFKDEAKKYFVNEYHYWYETDMSDRDEGSKSKNYTLNYSNIIIFNNELYGVLVKTGNTYPKYYICTLEKKIYQLELAGGYNKNSFTWTLKDNIQPIDDYLIINEYMSYNTDNNQRKLNLYYREVIGLFKENCIYNGDEVIGFNFDNHQFIISDTATYTSKIINDNKTYIGYTINTLVKVDREFLEKNIFDISYSDFSKGNYELFTKLDID